MITKAEYDEIASRMDQAHQSYQQKISKADRLHKEEMAQIYQETGWTEEEYKAQQQKFIDEFFSKWYRKGE